MHSKEIEKLKEVLAYLDSCEMCVEAAHVAAALDLLCAKAGQSHYAAIDDSPPNNT